MLSRRTFLRAGGAALALPFLGSLVPRAARAGGAPKRLVVLFFPNGSTQRQDWQLGGSGSQYTFGTAHASLEPYRAYISPFTNLDGTQGGAPDHSRGTAEFLTASRITNQTTPEVALSIDQAIADALDPQTPIRSLHLGPTPYPSGPPSDTGWPSGYNTYLSWSSTTTPNPPLESAQVAFDQVYGGQGSTPAADKALRVRQSVLAHTASQIAAIRPRLGASDDRKLDEYLTAVRDVESRLQLGQSSSCGDGTAPGDGLDFPTHTQAMLDIITLALQCDATRIVTYSMDYGFGNKDFTFLGQGRGRHHNLSHSGSTAEILTNHQAIVRWYMDQFAYFLGKLQSVDEGGSTLLDNTVIYLGSDVGDGWSHSHADLPVMLAGGGGGALPPGQLLDATGHSYASVLLALAGAMDADVPSFAGENAAFPL
jgi:hypothetical protein